jgi:hypothetical protein
VDVDVISIYNFSHSQPRKNPLKAVEYVTEIANLVVLRGVYLLESVGYGREPVVFWKGLACRDLSNELFTSAVGLAVAQHAVEDETPPLAVQPAEVGPNRCASVPATARSGVRKIRWCLHLATENDHFEPPKSHC